jgi:hypothetical protein
VRVIEAGLGKERAAKETGEASISLPRFDLGGFFVYGSTYRNEVKTMFSSECGAPLVPRTGADVGAETVPACELKRITFANS